ncbi:2-keto-3-deoxy-D-arabino-heptulosonate-7-phosphate synthase I beta [Candidatus Syntrophocurvum alkaliphilum]|uniref:2-keto-3-deoxy-D-arabino-heptulosonate-7-phosphate synthase I beta n=1 Tax=Candidatus Syntrophocurvum alkaliphilum TaxID=2293317 RepID=A0A6I6DG27_9FIRM|nr:3-deoxy-7-phosphoheptulonate synthase [Candidatus Syntrophocurvum alkaliphilum]QGT99862.1 2-keto-3-deoxy-D-arabino-heptulosonate-7-phosphate synthase I beta [Candidatus Syntrophocurvum alkaliphilum]
MIIVMEKNAGHEKIGQVTSKLESKGFQVHLSEGVERTIIGGIGQRTQEVIELFESLPGVEKVVPILNPFKLASREFKQETTTIQVDNQSIGDLNVQIIAGPCAVEGRDEYLEVAQMLKEAGATMLRGGAFKPRTSPYSFQGLEREGLEILKEAKEITGLPVVTEIVDPRIVDMIADFADILQVGARNMQNFFLLKELGRVKKPVLLKRGPSATIEEWIMAAEYIMSSGNKNVILCERGIRTFEKHTRNTLDISAVPIIKQLTHLPIIVDPSHGTGKWELVEPMTLAAVAAGCDGVMVEVHQNPSEALSDGPQSLKPNNFNNLVKKVNNLRIALQASKGESVVEV